MTRASRVSTGRRRLSVTVIGADRVGRAASGLGGWLERAAPRSARGEVNVALVSDIRIRTLNRQFRGMDKATDVLSFPAEDSIEPNRSEDSGLGDIAIATGVARRQAASAGTSFQAELRTLALHGLLHLLGYDHDRDDGEMRRVEERLRRRAGLQTGLIARASRVAGRT